MPYRIIVQDSAYADLDSIFAYIVADSPQNAVAMVRRVLDEIGGLATFPLSHPLAPESDDFPEEIRQLIVGPYRVLYTVGGTVVHVLRVRHGARLSLKPPSD